MLSLQPFCKSKISLKFFLKGKVRIQRIHQRVTFSIFVLFEYSLLDRKNESLIFVVLVFSYDQEPSQIPEKRALSPTGKCYRFTSGQCFSERLNRGSTQILQHPSVHCGDAVSYMQVFFLMPSLMIRANYLRQIYFLSNRCP